MTRAAREVLADCELAAELLEKETDYRAWRVHWVGALALIRAVGHVLHKVDGIDKDVRKASSVAYKGWTGKAPEHEIFRRFIDDERNNVLKNYSFNLHPLDEVDVNVRLTLQHPETGELSYLDQVVPIGENMYRPITEGYGEGEDARTIYREAIDWWHNELDAVDRALKFSAVTEVRAGGNLNAGIVSPKAET